MDIENILSLFYGNNNKMKYFYWYFDISSLMNLLKTNTYFFTQRKLIYNHIIVYLVSLCYIKKIESDTYRYYSFKNYNIEKMKKYLSMIKTNKYLKKNNYILSRYYSILKNYK